MLMIVLAATEVILDKEYPDYTVIVEVGGMGKT